MICFVLNLESEKKRLESISQQLKDLGISFSRIDAIRGDSNSVRDYLIDDSKNIVHRRISKNEIGCFLSHRMCWKQFLKTNENWALILEDDALLSYKLKEYFFCENWIPKGVDLIQLFDSQNNHEVKILDKISYSLNSRIDYLIRQIKPMPVTTTGYLISRKAAKMALLLSETVSEPVDEFLFNIFSVFGNVIISWKLNPSLVSSFAFTSAIDPDRSNKRTYKNINFYFMKYKLALMRFFCKSFFCRRV